MNNKMKFGLLLLAVSALVLVPFASAYPSYVPSKASSCGVCHVSPGGGGKLTPAGATFKSTGKLPVATPPVVTPPKVTPPVETPTVVTTPTEPTTPTAPTIVDEENDHHDDDHHDDDHHDGNHHDGNKEHKEQHEQDEEHDED